MDGVQVRERGAVHDGAVQDGARAAGRVREMADAGGALLIAALMMMLLLPVGMVLWLLVMF
jgi:hypothetical protein